jgi:hypothetical protein
VSNDATIEAGEQTSPESEGASFDGDISKLGRVERDVPLEATERANS